MAAPAEHSSGGSPTAQSALDRAALRVRRVVKPRMSALRERWSPLQWHRNRRADAFMLWFPKTGGTWVRLLLQDALVRHFGIEGAPPLELEPLRRLDPRVPHIRALHDDEPHWKRPAQLRRTKERYRGRRVILLVRDPRDTMVSLYFQMTRRWKTTDASLHEFIWQPRGALHSMIEFYNIWAENRHVPESLLLVRYEDIHADPTGMLRRWLELVGVPDVNDEVIDAAIADNSIDKLRQREQAGSFSSHRLRPGKEGDPESFKARRGKVGGYVDYLDPADADAIARVVSERLDPWYGYAEPAAEAAAGRSATGH